MNRITPVVEEDVVEVIVVEESPPNVEKFPRIPFFGGNWKTKKPRLAQAEELAGGLVSKSGEIPSNAEVAVFPQYSHLYQIGAILKVSDIGLGSQNIWRGVDPSTGELPIETLVEAGGRYVILGHSEQRHCYGETDRLVRKRLETVLSYNSKAKDLDGKVTVVLCVGETLQQREAKETQNVVATQLYNALNNIIGVTLDNLFDVVIAYEPVWAIGTGINATPEQAEEVHSFIREQLKEIAGMYPAKTPSCQKKDKKEKFVQITRIIYGGSVKRSNITELMAQPNIDGALVGGASLNADDFIRIVREGTQAHYKK